MAKRIDPRSGVDYTFTQIVNELDLRDSACLDFTYNGKTQSVQDSHCGEQAMLALPHWADSLWTYVRETEEWIPIFRFSAKNTIKIEDLVDMEVMVDPDAEDNREMWVTPKGLPREQCHKRLADGTITDGTNICPPVEFDEDGKSPLYYQRINNPGFCEWCKGTADKRFSRKDIDEGLSGRSYAICKVCLDADNARITKELDDSTWD